MLCCVYVNIVVQTHTFSCIFCVCVSKTLLPLVASCGDNFSEARQKNVKVIFEVKIYLKCCV